MIIERYGTLIADFSTLINRSIVIKCVFDCVDASHRNNDHKALPFTHHIHMNCEKKTEFRFRINQNKKFK